jgi:hypothetical protein
VAAAKAAQDIRSRMICSPRLFLLQYKTNDET